jgi:hypothetical protein
MNEATYELVEPGFSRLSATLAELIEALRSYRP